MIGYIDPTKQAFTEFRGNNRIHMLNRCQSSFVRDDFGIPTAALHLENGA